MTARFPLGRIVVFATLQLLAAGQAQAGIIFSESFTGADLYADSRVSFPARTPSLSGSSLLFDTGTNQFEKLLVLPLLPAGTLTSFETVVVEISMNLTALRSDWPTDPGDHDPGAFVGDGNEIMGFLAADNDGGTIATRRYEDAGNRGIWIEERGATNGLGYPSIGQSFDVSGTITLLADSTEVFGSFYSGSTSHVFTQPIDRTQEFSFIFLAHDAEEPYQLNSLSIQVSGEPVPEPSSLVIALGLIGIGTVGRFRKGLIRR